MSDNNGLVVKAMPDLAVQAQAVTDPIHRRDDEVAGGIGPNVLAWMVSLSDAIVAPWWSRRRDMQLKQLAYSGDFFQGAMYKIASKLTDVPPKVLPRDPSVKSYRKAAEDFNMMLIEGSELSQGWSTFLPKWLQSLWTQDNGAFAEIIGDGDPEGPIKGPALGLKMLDASRCNRTSNPLYPIIYTTTGGKRVRYHYTRIIMTSQMPDPAEEMNNVGHCWLSRCVNTVQNLIDIGVFKQEKLGSRPNRQMIIGKGIEAMEIWEAFRKAEMQMDAQGLKRYAKNVVVGGLTKDDSIERLDLTTTDGLSDEKVMTDIGVYILSMTGGFPPRWIWPATTTGATKADAESQHMAGMGSGGQALSDIAYLLGGSERGIAHSAGKFLPTFLKLVFDYQDDQEDESKANISNVRSQVWDRNIKNGVVNTRVAREQMLDAGEITDSQFEDLELEDGRLADGSSIDSLFYTNDPVYKSIFGDVDPIQPDVDRVMASLSVARYVSANPENVSQKRTADIAVKALEYILKKAQSDALQAAAQAALAKQQNNPPPAEGGNPQPDNNQPPQEQKTKERSTYRLALVRNMQLLWEGRNTKDQFISAMKAAITRQFPEAWELGSKPCGITLSDLTDEEELQIEFQIEANVDALPGFADFIQEHSRSNGGTFDTITSRGDMWLNSYDRVTEMGKASACGNQKMTWVLGSTEEHCKDCLNMAGRVYRASVWYKNGILPKSMMLACGGYRCDCKLAPTSKPVTRGRPPKFKSLLLDVANMVLEEIG